MSDGLATSSQATPSQHEVASDDPFYTLPSLAEELPAMTNEEIDRLLYGEPESCSPAQS